MAGFYYIPVKYEENIIRAATESMLQSTPKFINYDGVHEAFRTAYNSNKLVIGKIGVNASSDQIAVLAGSISINTREDSVVTYGVLFNLGALAIVLSTTPDSPDLLTIVSVTSGGG